MQLGSTHHVRTKINLDTAADGEFHHFGLGDVYLLTAQAFCSFCVEEGGM
jgi:hypothetical protein